MAIFAEQVETIAPRLVLLDPLYLWLGGSDGRDLYGMGQVSERPQIVCDSLGVSFVVVTHFNRGGKTGASRISGAGPAEWGRVLIGAEVKSRHTDPRHQSDHCRHPARRHRQRSPGPGLPRQAGHRGRRPR
jgi:hypothetical protein